MVRIAGSVSPLPTVFIYLFIGAEPRIYQRKQCTEISWVL